ncbi:uncharacterized protein BJ171DRAFT_85759 [Polychytrium aggregatum]|uniref:uncharacterized protein n=1 Tax=Polychytrium aggregatum TaxID=110093 RepID=UPI0022FE3E06|nr:uncharacterized protein BJ171DRAFT_85759 [Polychytrium aggregatum]KAI9190593.1 hypothetical protein BJ171DRAFT_85759 [Polychytrium aggregatum]
MLSRLLSFHPGYLSLRMPTRHLIHLLLSMCFCVPPLSTKTTSPLSSTIGKAAHGLWFIYVSTRLWASTERREEPSRNHSPQLQSGTRWREVFFQGLQSLLDTIVSVTALFPLLFPLALALALILCFVL